MILTLGYDKKRNSIINFSGYVCFRAGFPKQQAASIVLKSISSYFVTAISSSIKQIFFALCDMESIGIYTAELAKLDS